MALREGNSALHWAATRPEHNMAPTAVAVGHFVQVGLRPPNFRIAVIREQSQGARFDTR
jgi:hypothetical protein